MLLCTRQRNTQGTSSRVFQHISPGNCHCAACTVKSKAGGAVPEGRRDLQKLKLHAEQCSQQHAQHDLACCPQGSHNSPHQPWVLVHAERSIRKGNATICASAPLPKLAHMSLTQILHGVDTCVMGNKGQQTSECAAGTSSWKGQLHPRSEYHKKM